MSSSSPSSHFSNPFLFLFLFLEAQNQNTGLKEKEAKMSVHRNPPFRAEHLGSLLRPKDFLKKRAAFESKEIKQEELTKAEDEAIKEVLEVQREAGFSGVTDGEYRYVFPPFYFHCIA